MLDSVAIKNWPFEEVRQTYTATDTIHYALAVGYGSDPMDLQQLPFVYERDLRAAPTMAVVLSYPGLWISDPRTGIDWLKAVHGEQTVRFHKPLPAAGTVVGLTRVTTVTDKGRGKGAIFVQQRTLRDEAGGLLATLEQVNFCRGDGGYSENGGADGRQVSDPPPPAPHPIPEASPAQVHDMPTLPQQALLYRLCADRHPIHVDPVAAAAVGFPRPLLHGLGSYGLVGRVLMETCCDWDPSRLKVLRTRFAAPFFPGETLRTELWRDGAIVSFRCIAKERNVVVVNNGMAEIA